MTVTDTEPRRFTKLQGTVKIRADVFPAAVRTDFMELPETKKRAIVTADRIYVLGDAQGDPALLYEGRLVDYGGDAKVLMITTEDGVVELRRDSGCGCGSRLRSFRAYGRAVRMAMP